MGYITRMSILTEEEKPSIQADSARNAKQPTRIRPTRYVTASLSVGFAFVVLDAALNANPLAQAAYAPFAPIARLELDFLPALAIDVAYGFVMCAIFMGLQHALPGSTPVRKGLTYGLLVWFFRVFMNAATQWFMFAIPAMTVAYSLGAGLLEMVLIGGMVGILTSPRQ